jgi:phosphate-selective porin O/P
MSRSMVRWELALAGVVLMTQAAVAQVAQTPQGWPGVDPPPAAAPARPAEKPKAEPPAPKKRARARRPATTAAPAAPAPVPELVSAAAAPVAEPAIVAPPAAPVTAAPAEADPVVPRGKDTDLVAALQQQSQLLSRLASELDASRAIVAEQGRLIAALEKKAAPAVPVAAAPPPPPPVITVDTGGAKLRLAGLVQGWFTASDAGVADTFRLRRGEVKLGGEVNRRVRWDLVLDAAKALSVSNSYVTVNGQRVMSDTSVGQSGRMLQDAFVTLTRSSSFAIALGQQKLPLAMEGVQSSSRLETVERALFMSDKGRGGTYGDIRDFGVMAKGKVAKGQLEYSGGIFNGFGETQNDVDRDGQKPFMGRLVARPSAVKGLSFGSSYGRTTAHAGLPTRRDRAGVDASFARGRVLVASELMTGHDGILARQGYYAHTTYRVFRDIDAVFRADRFDPDTTADTTAANVAERDWLGGMNWRIAGPSALLQVNYLRKTFLDVQPSRHVVMANVQTAW